MELFEFLKKHPEAFPDKPKKVRLIQTHISFVFLTGKFAYKIKKSVNFGFLDFTSLKNRKLFCEKELELNKRFSRDLYLDVLPITKAGKRYEFAGTGAIVEYCVRMKELPQDRIMTELVKKKMVDELIIDELVGTLADFYEKAENNPKIDEFGKVDTIRFNIDENFSQTEEFIGKTIDRAQYDFIRHTNEQFIKDNHALFSKRVKGKKIRDCHGDLHTGNIFVLDKIYIFDCIEFNERFRYSDIVADIAYLVMDLEFLRRPVLANYFVAQFEKVTGEKDVKLLRFYMCYRAYVKLKITSFQLNDPNIDSTQEIVKTAKHYSNLSFEYAAMLRRLLPCVIIVSGFSGTGKSRWTKIVTELFGIESFRTDLIRKEIFNEHWKAHDYGKGIYSKEAKERVYDEMLLRAGKALALGKPVALDGTFERSKIREKVKNLAGKYHVPFVVIETACSDEEIMKDRFYKRRKKGSLSHADWNMHMKKKKDFEQIQEEKHIVLDTVHEISHNKTRLVLQLDSFGLLG